MFRQPLLSQNALLICPPSSLLQLVFLSLSSSLQRFQTAPSRQQQQQQQPPREAKVVLRPVSRSREQAGKPLPVSNRVVCMYKTPLHQPKKGGRWKRAGRRVYVCMYVCIYTETNKQTTTTKLESVRDRGGRQFNSLEGLVVRGGGGSVGGRLQCCRIRMSSALPWAGVKPDEVTVPPYDKDREVEVSKFLTIYCKVGTRVDIDVRIDGRRYHNTSILPSANPFEHSSSSDRTGREKWNHFGPIRPTPNCSVIPPPRSSPPHFPGEPACPTLGGPT